jgi:lambda family phage tail tape measure protein
MSTVGINVQVTQTGTQAVTVQLQNMGGAAQQSAQSVDLLNNSLRALGLGAALAELKQYVDTWANVKGMIDVSTNSLNQAAAVTERIMDIAQGTRQPLTDITQLYQRMSVQADALGLSQNQVLQITQELGQALVIQHATVAQASGALLQFSQALGTGKVRAQEWNSILTGLPVLAKTVASELGVATSQVKAMITAGTLSSEQLAQAVLKSQATLQSEFDKSAHTISQSFTVLNNAITQYIGELAESLNATNLFGDAMATLAKNIDPIAKTFAALATGVGVFLGVTELLPAAIAAVSRAFTALWAALLANPFVAVAAAIAAALVALYEWRDAITVVTAQGITLGDYMRAIWGGFSDGVITAWNLAKPYLDAIVNWFSGGAGGLADVAKKNWDDMLDTSKSFINSLVGLFVGLSNAISDIFHNLPEVVVSAVVEAVNGAGGILSSFVNTAIGYVNQIGDKVDLHIDPVKFAPLEDQFKNVTTNIGNDFATAMKTDFLGNFTTALTQAAAGYAAVRKTAARQGGGGSADLDAHGAPAQIVDPKAAKELEKLQNQLRSLLNQVDPAAGAFLDMAKDSDILSAAYAKHLITLPQLAQYLQAVADKYKDIINPVGAYVDKLNQETTALGLDGDERTINTQLLQEELALKQKHYVITDAQIAQMKTAITQNVTANELAQKRNSLLQTYVQPQKDFNQGLEAANQLYAKGTLSAQQYADAVQQIDIAYLDTQKTFTAGLQSGLLSVEQDYANAAKGMKDLVVSAFSDMNDALAKFVTTGKLDFSSLVDNIAEGFLKIELQVLESKVLTSLFGNQLSGGMLTGGSLSGMLGFQTGGYTGDGAPNQIAGFVHKGEVVIPANVVAQPGMKDYLTALANGSGSSAAASTVATGGTATGSATAVQMNVIVQNNNASQSSVSVQQGSDANGQPNLTVLVNSLESELAGRVQSGRGKLWQSIGTAYGLRASPSRG